MERTVMNMLVASVRHNRLAQIRFLLDRCLEDMDELGLMMPGLHLSHANDLLALEMAAEAGPLNRASVA
jgi:hypothetical protein